MSLCKDVYANPSAGHKDHLLCTSAKGMPALQPWVSFHLVHSLSSNKLGAVQCNTAGSSCAGRVVQSLLKSTRNHFTPCSEETHFSVLQDICLSFGCLCYSRCHSPSWK